MKHSYIRKLFSIPALALFAAVTFFTGCSELEAKKSTLTFRVTDEMAQKIQEAAYSHTIRNSRAARSALTENLVFSITLSGEYEETKTCPATAGQKITFEAVPVGAKITATAAAYIETAQASDSAEESDADRVILYTGMSEEYIILEGENSIPIKLIKTSNKFTITFDSNGGSEVTPISVEPGTAATQPASPLKEGYTFTNWYLGDDTYNWTQKVNGNLVLRAEWKAITYKVVFEPNKGTGLMASLENVKYDTSFTLPECTFTPPQGCKFAGWALSEDDNILYKAPAEVTNLAATPDAVIHLYAVWTEITNHYITYENVPDGIENINPKTFNESYDIRLADLTDRTGYIFDGWYDNAELSGDSISGWDAGETTDDVTLYAKWTLEIYRVTFITEKATAPESAPYTIEKGIDKFEEISCEGYTFAGWFDAETGGNKVESIPTGSTGDVTLYAKWTQANSTYTVNHWLQNLNGGDEQNETNYSLAESGGIEQCAGVIGEQTNATAKNYEGFAAQEFSQKEVEENGSTVINIYYIRNTVSLSVSLNGGTTNTALTDGKLSCHYGGTVSIEEPSKTNAEFEGWYKDESFENDFDINAPVTSDGTIYARYKYTVTYEVNGGDTIDPAVVKDGETFNAQEPQKATATFEGWYTDSEYTTQFTQQTITQNITLYARWSYTITFNENAPEGRTVTGAMEDQNITERTSQPLEQSVFECTGYTFAGWNTMANGEGITYADCADITVIQSITLYAKWTAVTYYIRYYDGDTSLSEQTPTEFTIENLPLTLEDATKSGYKFEGWYTDPALTDDSVIKEITEIPASGEGYVLYAKWSAASVSGGDITISFAASETDINITDAQKTEGDVTYTVLTADDGYTDYEWTFDDAPAEEQNDICTIQGDNILKIDTSKLVKGAYVIFVTAKKDENTYSACLTITKN